MDSLRQQVRDTLAWALAECQRSGDLEALRKEIETQIALVEAPMRVAVIGRENSGKSSLVNALFGELFAVMGNRPVTRFVNWFRYSDKPSLVVHKTDGSEQEDSFERLKRIVDKKGEASAELDEIQWVEGRVCHPLLNQFDLIDTPGLKSYTAADSQKTLDLLNAERLRPHAVVVVFDGTIEDQNTIDQVRHFQEQQGHLLNGLTAIGVVTKLDEHKKSQEATPEEIVRSLQQKFPWLNQLLFQVIPICAPQALGGTLSDRQKEALCTLGRLAKAEPQQFDDLLKSITAVQRNETGLPPIPMRAELFDTIGKQGIRTMVTELKKDRTIEMAIEKAYAESNIEALRSLIVSHFGNRAFLTKSYTALASIGAAAKKITDRRLPGFEITKEIGIRIARLRDHESRFREYSVLGRYYRGEFKLPSQDVAERMLRLTGEHGLDCASRLGQPRETPIEALIEAAIAEQRYWLDPDLGSSDVSGDCQVLAASCGAILRRLREAKAHRDACDALLDYEY